MTGVTFTRGGYHRIGRNVTAGLGGYTVHRAGHWLFDGTGLGYGDVLGAGSTVVGYECDGCAFTYRDGLPYPTGEDGTPSTFEILGHLPDAALHAVRRRHARPSRASRASWSTSPRACSGPASPRRWSASGTATPCSGAYTNERGRDRGDVGVDRLGPRAGGTRPADRADHPERADPTWVTRRLRVVALPRPDDRAATRDRLPAESVERPRNRHRKGDVLEDLALPRRACEDEPSRLRSRWSRTAPSTSSSILPVGRPAARFIRRRSQARRP